MIDGLTKIYKQTKNVNKTMLCPEWTVYNGWVGQCFPSQQGSVWADPWFQWRITGPTFLVKKTREKKIWIKCKSSSEIGKKGWGLKN